MRVLIQRVSKASVHVDGKLTGKIGSGLLLLVGISGVDTPTQLEAMTKKILHMRIFPALDGRSGFDRSVLDIGGEILAVSQFTLYADCRKGRRPSFIEAARPEPALALFDQFVEMLRTHGPVVQTGEFGADMDVMLHNDGPVTIWLDSEEW
jgi:D-tyrosyl-tRNA(Tyr) deacylase